MDVIVVGVVATYEYSWFWPVCHSEQCNCLFLCHI